jgi:hypothetical protein
LRTLLLGTVVCAMALTVWYEKRRADEATRVLQANGLAWQLADLPDGMFRVVVEEVNTGSSRLMVRRVRILGLGLAKVSLHHDNQVPTVAGVSSTDPQTDFELTFVAHQVADRGGDHLHVFMSLHRSGAAASPSSISRVAPQSILDENVDFKLRSGDFPRGQRIDFFAQEGVAYTLLVQ